MTEMLFPSEDELSRVIVGPDSVTWRYTSDWRLYFAMLYPLLLQVAHPTVGAGVRDFSDFDRRPFNRLLRTIDYVTVLVYGGTDAAAMGRRLRASHKGFQGVRPDGKRYYALEPEAYAWVHATLLETYVTAHAHFGRPMRSDQIDRFYREYKGLGRLVGVRDRDLPPDWASFRDYFDHTVTHELVHNETVDRVIASVRYAVARPIPLPDPLWRAIRAPARRGLWLGGIGLMAPELRTRFGVPWSARDEREYRALGRAMRAATPVMPRRLQISGPGQLRLRRRAIARGPMGKGDTGAAPPVRAAA